MKNCPFCKSKSRLHIIKDNSCDWIHPKDHIFYKPYCTNMDCILAGGTFTMFRSRKEAIELWDNRKIKRKLK